MEQRCREKLEMEQKIIGAGNFSAGNKGGANDWSSKKQLTSQADFLRQLIEDTRKAEWEEKERLKKLLWNKDKDGDVNMAAVDPDELKKLEGSVNMYKASAGSKYEPTSVSELNKMLSRKEEELPVFEWVDRGLGLSDSQKTNPRLMTADQVPEGFVLEDDDEEGSM